LLPCGGSRRLAHMRAAGHLHVEHARHHQDGQRRCDRQLGADTQILDETYHFIPQYAFAKKLFAPVRFRAARGRMTAP
jgi:hypothetical protein